MTQPAAIRRCRCGTPLAHDNRAALCSVCKKAARDHLINPPTVAPDFWEHPQLQEALASWHMGHVFRAYRLHPWHGEPLKQKTVAAWIHLTQVQLSRIENGKAPADLANLSYWARTLGIPHELLWFKMADAPRAPTTVAARLDTASETAERKDDETNRRDALRVLGAGMAATTGLRDLILGAARDSAVLDGMVNTPRLEARTLDDAQQDLHRLATDYVLDPDLHRIFSELVSVRDRLQILLERHGGRPNDARDLHVLLGATCTLLASISHDLAEPHAAMIQTRTALTFAELSGHQALETWIYCTRAMVASWWGTPQQVLRHASDAGSTSGVAGIRLAGLAARAHAQLGNRRDAVGVLRTAQEERGQLTGNDSLSDLGAVFSFSRARQHYYNAATFAHLGDWQVVQSEAQTVIGLYDHPTASQTWPATLALSQIYLAQARLHIAGPDGALATLRPVLAIPAEQRIPQTASALAALQRDLRAKPLAKVSTAGELDEAIRDFRQAVAS